MSERLPPNRCLVFFHVLLLVAAWFWIPFTAVNCVSRLVRGCHRVVLLPCSFHPQVGAGSVALPAHAPQGADRPEGPGARHAGSVLVRRYHLPAAQSPKLQTVHHHHHHHLHTSSSGRPVAKERRHTTSTCAGITDLKVFVMPLHTTQETRYRQRYLDLMCNPEVRNIFFARTKVIQFVRRFLDDRGFLEVRLLQRRFRACSLTAHPARTRGPPASGTHTPAVYVTTYCARTLTGARRWRHP